MKCYQCNQENSSEAKFCQHCGSDFKISNDTTKLVSMPPQPADLESPKLIGLVLNNRFKIIKLLGEGGMGHIYLAEDTKLKRKVAIKSITESKSRDPSSKARFLREAQVVSQLEHPNICTVYEIFEEDGCDYFVMQYIDGVTLGQVTNAGPLSLHKILDISLQVCDAMSEAHSKKIVHRDIKPTNIMINRRGTVKVLDFGLAKPKEKFFESDETEVGMKPTEQGVVLGTIPYMSPEQARGVDLDFQSDIFSFGSVLFECIEGRHPFSGNEQIETLYNILNRNIVCSEQLPDMLKEIISKALSKDKTNRFTSFQELKEALLACKMSPEIQKVQTPAETKVGSKRSGALKKQTGSRDLSAIVKGLKSSTTILQPIKSSRSRKMKHLLWLIPVLILFSAIGYYKAVILKKEVLEINTIFLEEFANKTEDPDLSGIIHFLLVESLNQFDSIMVLTEKDLGKISQEKMDFYKIQYTVTGVINHQTNYSIDAELIPVQPSKNRRHIAIPGFGKNSFLENQVDYIANEIYLKIKGKEPIDAKKTSDVYGTNWEDVALLAEGLNHFAKFNTEAAIQSLLDVEHLLISKYYLADLYYFNGERDLALKQIKAVSPQIHLLTKPMKLRVLALKARIEFDFQSQKKHLVELNQMFPFSKGVYYELGEAYFHMGQAREASKYYLQALDLDKAYSKAINHLGYCYSYLGEHRKAIEYFQEYRGYDQTANAYDSLGDGYFFSGDLTLAAQFKEAAIHEAKRDVPWAYLTLADIFILQARYGDAESSLSNYLKCVSPHHKNTSAEAEVKNKLATIRLIDFQSSGQQIDDALSLITESLEIHNSTQINNETAEAHWIRGLILLRMDETVKAAEELKWLKDFSEKYKLTGENFSPPLKFALHLDAMFNEKKGQPEKAIQNFIDLMSMKPQLSYWITYFNYPFFQTEYASFLFRNGTYDQCEVELNECLNYNPDYIPALWIKYQLKKRAGQDDAASILLKIRQLYGESEETNTLRKRLTDEMGLNQ